MPTLKVVIGPDGTQVTALPDIIATNIGEELSLQGVVIVYDQNGDPICEQPLVNTVTQITGGTVFLSSNYGNAQQGGYDANVNYEANPIVFAASSPGALVVAMTGYGCQELAPDPGTALDTVDVAASVVGTYPGVVYPPSYVHGYFNFQRQQDGRQSQITFGDIVNAGSVPGNFGILQLVTSSRRFATLADGTQQFIADSAGAALDEHDGAAISPLMPGVQPGDLFCLTLQDAPGLQIVPHWMLGRTLVDIASYVIEDTYTAYLMYQSTQPNAQWVPLASVNWSVRGRLERQGRTWAVDAGETQLVQPVAGVPFPFFPFWNGTAQGNVLARVVDDAYYETIA